MAKSSGLGDNFYLSGYDLTTDIGSLGSISGGPALLDVTSIDKSAYERIGGLRNGNLEFMAFFDTAVGASHARLSTLPTADVIATYARGTTLGNPAASMVAKQINYDGTRAADGMFTFAVQAQSNGYGIEWGVQGTAGKRSDTTATNGTSIDLGVPSGSFGLQAYLHVFSFTGTSVTVTLQGSSDDGAGDPYANITGGSFTAATAVTSERIATSNTQAIERYIRVVTTGTFSQATFAVNIIRNDTAVVF